MQTGYHQHTRSRRLFAGNIVVFTGILPICRDEAGLAAVVAHGVYSPFATFPNLF